MFHSVGEYQKAKEYHEEALAISKEIGDKKGEGLQYGNLGIFFQSVGGSNVARKHLQSKKKLVIEKEKK